MLRPDLWSWRPSVRLWRWHGGRYTYRCSRPADRSWWWHPREGLRYAPLCILHDARAWAWRPHPLKGWTVWWADAPLWSSSSLLRLQQDPHLWAFCLPDPRRSRILSPWQVRMRSLHPDRVSEWPGPWDGPLSGGSHGWFHLPDTRQHFRLYK